MPACRCLLFFLSLWLLAAQPLQATTLEVYVSDGCPHCAAARDFLENYSRETPSLRVIYKTVDDDPLAQRELVGHSLNNGIWPPGVPTFVIEDRVMSGFFSEQHSGPRLLSFINHGRPANQQISVPLLGTISLSDLGLPLFTLTLGLVDGFNPCAMWVLLFLLSLLVHLNNRRRMALIAGTFVLVSGAVYYAFMAAWLNLFLLTGFNRWVYLILALVALLIGAVNIRDFFRPGGGFTLSIPDSAKPGLYARMRKVLNQQVLTASLFGVAVLAVMVNFIELLCTAGIPAIYTAVLTQQGLSPTAYYGYLGLYIAGYIADDSLMVGLAVYALSSSKLTVNTGRWLKLLSGIVMLVLGEIMLLHPQWLM